MTILECHIDSSAISTKYITNYTQPYYVKHRGVRDSVWPGSIPGIRLLFFVYGVPDYPGVFMTAKRSEPLYPEFDPNDPDSLDEYYESTKLEARFDPLTIQLLVVEAVPKHAAYGMMFDEYRKQRTRFNGYDTSEKKHLSFYFPAFYGRVSADVAISYDISQYKFMILLVELGLIAFQFDYHDEYTGVRDGRKQFVSCILSETTRDLYMQLERHTIEMCSGSGARLGKSKRFVPTVPEWLYNAVTDAAVNLNMSASDFVYICWCIGASNALPEGTVSEFINRDIEDILARFRRELKEYAYQVSSTLSRMKDNNNLAT